MTELSLRSPLCAPVYHVDETRSTMDEARRLVRNDAPSGTVVVTDYQSAGRGRRAGRVWHAAPCESLMFTLMLHRPAEPVTRSLVMAAAVVRLLAERVGLAPLVKWPNDVLVNARKLCGILADHDDGWLYLGVGLNVRQRAFPPEIAATATSVALEAARLRGSAHAHARPGATIGGGDVDSGGWPAYRDSLLQELLERYVGVSDLWHGILSERLWMRDREVEIVPPAGAGDGSGETVRGIVRGIEHDGRLVLEETRPGRGVHRIAAGEVSLYPKASQ